MKISDYIIKSYSVGITFPFLSMEMVCVQRPEIKTSILRGGIGGACAYVSILIDLSCQH